MSRFLAGVLLSLLLVAAAWAQAPAVPPTDPQAPAQAGQQPQSEQSNQQQPPKSKIQRAKEHVKEHFKEWCALGKCWNLGKKDQDEQAQGGQGQAPPPTERKRAGNDEESSSKDTKVDLSPPADDVTHPGSAAASDVNEFHAYDPHKAEKDVEVGDFYFKRKNYKAAISRYRSALTWKPNDAVATFRLAQALERNGELAEARRNYEAYLKILPHGPNAEEAQKAVERLTLQSQSRETPERRR